MGQHTAVGRSGIVPKIFSADWQAGFPGNAGNAEIDFIGGNDQRAKNHLSKGTGAQLRRFDLRRQIVHGLIHPQPLPHPSGIVLSPFLHRISQRILPTPAPTLCDEFLIQTQTVWQTYILHGARVHIAAVDCANALRLPLNLHHQAAEAGR